MTSGLAASTAVGVVVTHQNQQQTRRNNACFAAGTKLLTPDGPKAIEEFKVGDPILSRSEYDPNGPLQEKLVEEAFCSRRRSCT